MRCALILFVVISPILLLAADKDADNAELSRAQLVAKLQELKQRIREIEKENALFRRYLRSQGVNPDLVLDREKRKKRMQERRGQAKDGKERPLREFSALMGLLPRSKRPPRNGDKASRLDLQVATKALNGEADGRSMRLPVAVDELRAVDKGWSIDDSFVSKAEAIYMEGFYGEYMKYTSGVYSPGAVDWHGSDYHVKVHALFSMDYSDRLRQFHRQNSVDGSRQIPSKKDTIDITGELAKVEISDTNVVTYDYAIEIYLIGCSVLR